MGVSTMVAVGSRFIGRGAGRALSALATVLLVGQPARALEIDANGRWQVTASDCGPSTSFAEIVEDVMTGVATSRVWDCGTVQIEGQVARTEPCTSDPVAAAITGTTYASPPTGYSITDFTVDPPVSSLSFGCDDPPAMRVVYESRLEGTITDDGNGTATRIDGALYTGVLTIYDTDENVCHQSDGGGAQACSFVLLRTGVTPGTAVAVEPFDGAVITLSNVSSSGDVSVVPLSTASGPVPPNFTIATNGGGTPLYFDISSTAAISGGIEICLPYADADANGIVDGTGIDENDLLVLHDAGSGFVALPPASVTIDTVANVICAQTESLSQFVFGAATTMCGNGVVEGGEDCDEGVGANGDTSTCCTASCTFRTSGETCRPSAGECDGTAETCTGGGGACPANGVAAAGTPCTADGNVCTIDECDGFGVCGTPAGAGACDDGDFCTAGDACNGVVCEPGAGAPDCGDGDPCTLDQCTASACTNPPAPDGTSCDDDDACTANDECESGTCLAGVPACGTPIGVAGTKLVVVDKEEAAGKAKLVFVAKDGAIMKGPGTDPGAIAVQLDVSYDAEAGRFTLPAGASDGTAGWVVNREAVAKYVNKTAPAGPTEAKVAVLKPGKVLKVVGKGLGDQKLDILAAGAPSGDVTVVYQVDNGGDVFLHCTAFGACAYKPIGAGTGAKLVCKNGTPVACPLPASPSGAFFD